MTQPLHKSHTVLTLLCVYCHIFQENWLCYNDPAMFVWTAVGTYMNVCARRKLNQSRNTCLKKLVPKNSINYRLWSCGLTIWPDHIKGSTLHKNEGVLGFMVIRSPLPGFLLLLNCDITYQNMCKYLIVHCKYLVCIGKLVFIAI